MSKDQGGSKGKFKLIECISALLCEVPGGAFARKPGKGNRNGGVSIDKSSVKVCEAEEGLYVVDLPRFWPVLDAFDFVVGHGEAFGREHLTEVFNRGDVE